MKPNQTFWMIAAAFGVALLVAAGVAVGRYWTPAPAAPPPGAPAVAAESEAPPQDGSLEIWVAGGVQDVGDNYWVYLNGQIVDAPPRSNPVQGNVSALRETDGGWLYRLNAPGDQEILESRGGEFSDTPHKYVDPQSGANDVAALSTYVERHLDPNAGDALHLFNRIALQRPPGEYTVEVAYLSQGHGSFAFAMTAKRTMTVYPGGTSRIYVGLPDDWSDPVVPPAAGAQQVCPGNFGPQSEEPDTRTLMASMRNYRDDPVVQALLALDVSALSKPSGIVLLDLPPSLGGPREFDRAQIGDLANAVLAAYPAPSHEQVAACRTAHPDYPESYDRYDKMLTDFEDQLQAIRTLAGN
jgi:hypothetical protein